MNLGIGLARHGKRVLLIDADSQGSLTVSLGYHQPDRLPVTLATIMGKVLSDSPISAQEGILHHAEGVDLLPSNIELSGIDMYLVTAMSRETVLRQYIDIIKPLYDYILVDCMPSLGMMTVNALAVADSVLIPVQAQYLSLKGLEQLLQTIVKVRRQINTSLSIGGILLTMVDTRTNYTKDIISLLSETYSGNVNEHERQFMCSSTRLRSRLNIFDSVIPVRCALRKQARKAKAFMHTIQKARRRHMNY